MVFAKKSLSVLMADPRHELQATAEQANLCMEKRVSAARQEEYEDRVGSATDWGDWRARHQRYIEEEVRRRYPLSAAFAPGEPSLRPGVEPNQYLLRVERIDGVLDRYCDAVGRPVDLAAVNGWIAAGRGEDKPAPKTVGSLADRDRLVSGTPATPKTSALEDLTELLNEERQDGRPTFVAFAAEFPDVGHRPDWARHICERCGLAHLFVDGPATLALFRYRVQDVIDTQPQEYKGATVFAVPTAIDQPFCQEFFPAPDSIPWGHAVGLSPADDCAHLAAELIHARIDYQAEYWVRVGVLDVTSTDAEIARLRDEHLRCLRTRPGEADYGRGCQDS